MSLSISVIIPAYNAEKTLGECLKSVASAIGEMDEIIVVDDCSNDSTVSIAQSFRCHLVRLSENQGAANARNEGAGSAKNDLYLFVDSDVLITKDNVENIRKYFEKFRSCHTVTLNVNPSAGHDNFFSEYKNLYMNHIISMGHDDVNYVYGSCCATRASGYIPWPTYLRLTEDSLWGYLQKTQGHSIHCLKHVNVTHLKNYSFYTLVKNDFLISSYFARAFWGFKRWNTLYTRENFGHTSKTQIASVLLAVAMTLMFFIMPEITPFLLVAWFLLNKDLFFSQKEKKGTWFFIQSVAWTFFDHLIYFCGIFHGSLLSTGEKEKVFERELT
ncbi:glycosyltransferase [Bacteriovorax stolpii]|uniref:Uncharacterized protein n=1 Tax=Bacteriovorax stolpii TaxID=960 RepID=A0A2K9NWK7_BACTC|nr:glycosyltransferase [Bacteriovorax stolpii]AUN99891.1 hypothetical protein C0V70_17625 [Bacteriovorax stolpii]QDK40116.1 glycosyltransferase [Bacteriovorax stolpii]TDP54216.1 glycosyl transferase family 2 [Bacteriovorax stolpii]